MDGKRRAYFLVAVFALLLRSTSGGCEDDVLGLADGYILDNQITASSELNANSPAKNGRLNYTAGSSWCASTSDSNPYLQIDLQTLHIICAVSTQGNSQGDQWVETYTLQSSTDGTTWTDYMQDGKIEVLLGNLNSKTTAKRVLFTVITARYLRVIAQDKHDSVCMRVELYGIPRLEGNIALFKPTSQSSTLSTYKSSHAVDGMKSTYFTQCTHTDASTKTNPWWRVDLGRVEPVAKVYILNRGDCCGDNLDGAEIRVGNSTTNGGENNHLCADNIQIPQGRPKYFSCKPKAYGKYVYIRIPGNDEYVNVCEVEVYSHYYMSNLALNQPASQVSTDHGGVASRAVDWNPNNQWGGGSCTHTNWATDAWWRVDLGSPVPVAEVVIVNRQCGGACANFMSSFEIRIGDSTQNGGATNPMCGGNRSMSTGVTKSFYCAPRRVGQYVYIRIPGNQKILSICEVEVYSTRRTIKACNNHPIGLDDSSKIPDNRFTASSSGSNKVPSLGRLNGGEAWLPATINNDEFLQIDLGSIYSVCSVATQGAPLADEWTKTYKIMTSLDNSNWTTYAESNVDKIFNGNNDRSSIIRNDLYDSPLAKFIRLYPLTYHNHTALRVEVYGSSEGCQSSLGIEDSQLFASSKSDGNHAANYSRLYSSSSWCSASASTSEYLQVDLGQIKTLTGVATQGDPTNDKWVTKYMVQFGDSNTRWFRQLSFQGNEGRDQTYVNWFSEPIETRLVRIVPLAWENSVCLRFDIYGCGVLLKVPNPTINDIQDGNLHGSEESFVELKCNSSSRSNVMTVAIRWGNDGRDITNLASGALTQGKFVLSTLRVNFTTAEDTLSTYNCTRQSDASRIVNCEKIFCCLAFYSSLAVRLEPAYQTAVVIVQLHVPAAVTKLTVDSILGTSAVVRWQRLPVGSADESPVAVYEIKLAKESNSNTAKSFNVTGNDTSRVLEKLEQNTRYEVKVRGISAVGSGLWSSTANFKTARNVYCEEKILGVETGFYPDMTVSSSQFNASTSASHSSISYAVDLPWCANRSDPSPYLEMDLVDVHVICALSTRGNPQGEYWVETYALQSSVDGTTWTDYKEGDQQRIFLGNYDSTSIVKEELYSGIVARKVRLHVKTFHGLACLKLQLFGVKQTIENLALNQPASQISTAHGGVASRAVDGNPNNQWGAGSCTHTDLANDPWWRVDLGSSFPVAEVVIVNRQCTGKCGDVLKAFEIRIGNSTTALDSSNQICGSSLQVVAGQRKSFRCVSTIRGRYVYIIRRASNEILTICEAEVYSAISNENLALGQSSIQSSTAHGGSSSRAVDGVTTKDYGQGSCSHSQLQSNPWWRVDLGSSRPVGEVVIVNRACDGACADYLKGFEIWIGDFAEQNGGISNSRCGNLHSLNNAETKSINCVPRLVGRYVYIRIPKTNTVLTLCEVEVYSRKSSNIVCATQAVGISDSFKIPDERLSASTSRAGNDPSKGRLTGSSAWVPSTNTDSNDYLEIDLGSVYFICGVITQGNPSANEWTKEYKIKTSLSNGNWTLYMEHGIEKIFPGNNDQTTLRRNGLITSPLAKFIRFYPVSFSTAKALRVEVYGYAQGSKTPLGLENGDILDSQLKASSNSPAAINGRLYNTSSWCSSATSSLEYLQVDLGNVKTIAGVATQGDPSSDKWTKTYALRYSYGGDRWTQYKGHAHQQRIFDGNNDRNSVQANWMTRPFVARYLRIYAQTWNSGICLRVDGYGSSLVNAPIIRPVLLDKIMQKTLGSSVVMTCVVYGMPQVSVTWRTNGEELANSSDISSTSIRDSNWEETVSNLTLTYKDAAYAKSLFQCTRLSQETRILQCKKLGVTCNAKYFGTLLEFESSASVSLANNLYLPEPPSQINITSISSTSVSLTWNNSDAGDAPILLYRVQYSTSSLNLIPVTMNKTTTTRSIYISMLQPYTDYTFNVQGVSAIGDGPVSKSTSLKTYLTASISISPPHVHKLHLHQRNVLFVCFGQGYPRPTITWKKDGNATEYPFVSTNVSAINSSKQLNVGADGVTYQEAGNYTCEVYNGVDGLPTINATVEVIFIPEFTVTPQAQTVIEGVSVIFNCSATGLPTPRISWSYNSAAELPPNSSQLSNGSLLISGVQNTVDYEGTYICSASNRAGVNVTQANLTVWAYPTISKTSRRSITILVGDPLNLTCVIVGDPQPVVVWSKYGIQRISGAKYESENSSLVIPRVSITDEGVYVCLGRSVVGSVSTNFTVIVQEPAKISVTGPQVLTLLRNEKNLTVECFGRGKPRPTITWKKNGTEISKNSSEIESGVVQVIGNSSDAWNVSSVLYLRIGGVTYNDAGNYTCEVYNGVDSNDTVDSTIRVLFKPEFVEEPKHVAIVLQGNNVTFPCDVTGVPKPSIIWLFSGAKLPPRKKEEDGSLTVYSVRNNQSYEGLYTCKATSIAGILISNVTLTVDVLPFVYQPLRNATLITGRTLNLTCLVGGDPVPRIHWTKNGGRDITRAKFFLSNSTLLINSVQISDEGLYECKAESRAGNITSSAYIEVHAPSRLFISPSKELKRLKHDKNITVDCRGYGKPKPFVKWIRNGTDVFKVDKFTAGYQNQVVQALLDQNEDSPWNVTSRLYLRVAGVIYKDAGNYTCEVFNGVESNHSLRDTLQVFFRPQFISKPNDEIILEGQNVTFPCHATGVPQPNISWWFNNENLPIHAQLTGGGNLTVYLVKNNEEFEGNYTCKAINRAGFGEETAQLIVDVVPSILTPLTNVTLLRGQTLNITCFANGDPYPTVQWTKDGNSTIPHAKFSQKNSRIVIGSVQISDEGLYECSAKSRAGVDNSKSVVKVQVEPKVFVGGNKTLILQKGQQNVIITCGGNGYPVPTVRWKKQTNKIPVADVPGKNSVEQKLFSDIQHPMENVTSDLYLRTGGVTYNESGNYTCTSLNGVGENTASTRVEVIFKPEFVTVPRSRVVNEGKTVTFMCAASGVPEPLVNWNFKGGNLPPYSTVLNGNLTISSVRNNKTYEGTYSCTASSRAGTATTDVVLTIHIPPQITKVLNESVVAERGDKVTLSCSASGDPSPRFHWTKDGSRFIPNATFENSNKTLQLTNVNSRDDGVYICWAINAAGNASTSSNLSVHARPSLLETFPKNTTQIEDNTMSLSCTGESIPAPGVSWFKHDEIVVSDDRVVITTRGKFERVTTLTIQKVKYEDRGVYTCSFANYRGSANSTGLLIVHVPPDISLPPASVKEKLGFRVTLNCTVRGFPLPSLVWIKDNLNLIGSEEEGITQEKDEDMIQVSTSLTIKQAKREDTGVYTCKANNSVASTLKSANLTVLEKPDRLEAQIGQTSSRSVVIKWKVLFDGNSPVMLFIVAHNISNGTVSYNVSSIKRQFKVLFLTPATFYNFSVTATNQLGTSDRVVVNTTTLEAEPGAPRFLNPIVISSRSIFINWTVPAITNGKLVKYIVYYDRTEVYFDNSTRPMNHSLPSNITWLLIKSLVPYTQYTFQVQAFTEAGGGNMSDSVGPVLTFEDVPGPPRHITFAYSKASETYLIEWSPPLEPNGIIRGYKVFLLVQRDSSGDAEIAKDKVFKIEDDSTSKSVGLHELNGDTTYSIIVQARTSINFGQNSTKTVKFTTPITSPPTPPTPPPANETTTTTAVIELTLFSDVNGPIQYYQVIVLRVPQDFQGIIPTPDDIAPNDIKTYDEAHKSSKPAAYIAFVFEANKFNLYKSFTLGNGEKRSDRKRREIKTSYYNGPLEPNTQYQAFTRAFTSESHYSQSGYIKIKTKEVEVKPLPTPAPSSGSSTGIIAGVVAVLIIAVIGVAVFIYIRRKRRENVGAPNENELQPLETVEARKEGSINNGFDLDVDGNRGPIPVKDLKAHYIRMHKNDNRLFSAEYKSLSITGKPTTEVCDLPENKVRNRYGNIKAYDHSRVKLNMEGSSDYINGNYIDGYIRPKQYIATIGPKPETSEHFWWLIWQENVSTIVMLTRPVENGKVKCHQYWPDKGNQEHGVLTVTVKETREFSEFQIRTLSLQMPSRPDLKPRTVTHFYFTAWPDHDVPDEATGLLQFWRVVKKASTNGSPMVVHCSAGVGRTGTFICIDAMMEQINASEELDIYNFVTNMREQRNYMVQRESQYIFIFYALLEATTFGDTEIASHDLRIKVQKMAARNSKTQKSNFEREFELLDGVVHQENTDFTSALKTVNAKKNRYTNVLPFEKSRVVLNKTSEDEEEDTSYINASYLEGYQQRKAYIATQAPMRDTVGDFWRMVWEEEVHSIVKLVPPKEDSEEAFIDYWSEVEATLHGSLSTETINFDNKETYSVRKINLSETETEKVRKVTLYTCTDWPKDGVPDDSMAVINFIGTLQKQQQQTGNHPIVVHCSDGIGRTGTLCALMTSLERVKLEDTVDVFTAVRMLRTQRPGMVQTLEQYRFIYDATLAYLDSFEDSLYQNFK